MALTSNPYQPPRDASTSESPSSAHSTESQGDDGNSLARKILATTIFAGTGVLAAILIVLPALGGADAPATAFFTISLAIVIGGLIGVHIS